MPDEVTSERVCIIAASAGIPLDATTAARVARAVNPTVNRFVAEKITLPMEVEPATFVVIAREKVER